MKIVEPQTPRGFSIFCDDVRLEATGKQIYIGVYTGEMFIQPAFPVTLPTFSIVMRFHERYGESSDDLVFRVYVPGVVDPLFTSTASRDQINAVPQPDNPDSEFPHTELGIIATFSNLMIREPGLIKARVVRGEEEINIGALRVRLNPVIAAQEAAH
jgi:hypothetical protein